MKLVSQSGISSLPELIISKAHEIVQCLPLDAELYKCVRCESKATLKELFHGQRCTPHFELETSGWEDEG